MGNHPSFSAAGPSATYQPETYDTSDNSTAGTVLPSVTAFGAGKTALAKETGGNLDTMVTRLTSILAALNLQRVETIWTDDTGKRFLRVDIGGSIVWTNVDGTASSAPGAGARPDNDSASAISRQTYKATAGGTGFVVNDVLEHFVVTDESGDLVGAFWVNVTQESKIAAPATNAISMVNAIPDGAATDAKLEAIRVLLAAGIIPAPGENHIGAIGGEGSHPLTPAIGAAAAYVTGKCIGGVQALTGFSRAAGKSGMIQSATLRLLTTAIVNGQVDAVIFKALPTVTTGLADGATFSVALADLPIVSKVLKFTAFDLIGAGTLATLDGIGKYMRPDTGTSAYVQLVARSNIALVNANDVTFGLGVLQD